MSQRPGARFANQGLRVFQRLDQARGDRPIAAVPQSNGGVPQQAGSFGSSERRAAESGLELCVAQTQKLSGIRRGEVAGRLKCLLATPRPFPIPRTNILANIATKDPSRSE